MSFTSGAVNEGEQAGEKLADHVTDHAVPGVIQIIQAVFERLWQTRIVIEIGKQ